MLEQQEVTVTQAPTALALIDFHHNILESSIEWAMILRLDEMPASSLSDILVRANDRGYYFFDCLRRVRHSKVSEQCYSLFVWSGREFDWIRWSISVIPDAELLFVHAQRITKELHYQQFFDLSIDMVMSIDGKGEIKSLNNATLELLGYRYEEMIGCSLFDFILKEDHEKINNVVKTFNDKQRLEGIQNRYVCKDGSIKWIEWSASYYANTGFIYGIGRDITQMKTEQRLLQKNHDMLNALSSIQELYISGADIRVLFGRILDELLTLSESEYGFIGKVLYNADHKPYLKIYAITNIAWNQETQQLYEDNVEHGLEFCNLHNLFGYTVRTGDVVICDDPANDAYYGGLPEGHSGLYKYLGLPIKGRVGLIGMIGIANRPQGYNLSLIDEIEPLLKVISSILDSHINSEEVEKLAHYDFLTQLYNRAYFEKQLLQAKNHANQSGQRFALMYLDLNNFKSINDTLGHKVGDLVLFVVARRLKDALRDYDILARLGGDEFGLLIPRIDNYQDVETVAQKIILAISKPFHVASCDLNIGMSIGIAVYPDSTTVTEMLYKFADYALYHAKALRKDYVFFSREIENLRSRRLKIESRLDDALQHEELFFEYQPQYDVASQKIVGVELLLRWLHPQLGLILPNEFIEVFEELGKADKLNLYVVNKAKDIPSLFCQELASSPFVFCVNISPNVLNFEEHFDDIAHLIANSCLSSGCYKFEFELTESSLVDNASIVKSLQALEQAGITIAIDDFGVAHSSLLRLKTLPIKTLKIDMSFVKDIVTDDKTAVIAASVIDLAKKLHLSVIAEGVETEAQLQALCEMGCHLIQGFYFSRPLALDAFKALLNQY